VPHRNGQQRAGKEYVCLPHDDATGCVTVEDYRPHITPDTVVATIVHTSPVTGMGVDVGAIAKAIRAVAPDCFIIIDGIQHAAHGGLDIDSYGIDGYAISPYKVFSRHGYGIGWASDRLTALPHDTLNGAPATGWELGTRDTGAYATWSDVVRHFEWLGGEVSGETAPRGRVEAAGKAIKAHEAALCHAMIHGTGNLPGLADMPGVIVIGGVENPAREGLVSFAVPGRPSAEIVTALNEQGIRTHTRKADHYSGNILDPLGLPDCIRVSLGHYNTVAEIAAFLTVMREMTGAATV
jgi:cysteine desulfurase/selenocysteine lyase